MEADDIPPNPDDFEARDEYLVAVRMWSESRVKENDPVSHPSHYTVHPSGVECIEIVRWMNFDLGNAIKYIWRAGLKGDNAIEDLKKAQFYIADEINRLENEKTEAYVK